MSRSDWRICGQCGHPVEQFCEDCITRPDHTRADTTADLIEQFKNHRDSSPFDSVTEIHEAVRSGDVPDTHAPGSLKATMQG